MGSLYGGLLAWHGFRVMLYDSWRQHVDAIRHDGLHLDGITGDLKIEVAATADVDGMDRFDIAVILVDANGTADAANVASRVLAPSGYALTLQNGIGNVETLSAALGSNRVMAGLSYHSAALVGPGHVTHTHAGPTYLGEIDGKNTQRLRDLVKVLQDSGFKPLVVENVVSHIWDKWVHNCAINAISAVSGLRVGEIARTPAADEMQKHIIDEALAIVKAKGISLPELDPAKAIKDFCRIKYNKPSMLQHMEEGRRTEIDALNGAVVTAGRKLGVATPYNDAITLMVKAREAYMHLLSSGSPIDYDALERNAKKGDSAQGASL
jgi:2-dehydropantoate 2-reductase